MKYWDKLESIQNEINATMDELKLVGNAEVIDNVRFNELVNKHYELRKTKQALQSNKASEVRSALRKVYNK